MSKKFVLRFIAMLAIAIMVMSSVATAEQLGNEAKQRTYGADHWSASNFTMIDISPLEYYLTTPGYITSWNYFVDSAIPAGTTSDIDLEVWRPTGNANEYTLIIRQAATLAGSGLQSVAASGATLITLVNPGDYLGFYVHQGENPLISLDYKNISSVTDPYLVPGGGSIAVGQDYVFSPGNGSRTYSLNVNTQAVAEPMSVMLGFMGLGSIAGFKRWRRK